MMYNYFQPQQVVQVNGKASVDAIQMAPNSSMLLMDTTAPIVWLCVSDGVGRVTSTPYDIKEHKEEKTPEANSIEQRLIVMETAIAEMERRINESYVKRSESEQNDAGNSAS